MKWKLSSLLLLLLVVFSPTTALAGSGTYFDYSVSGTTVTFDTHEPYASSCNDWGDYLPFIYDNSGNLLEGDVSCGYKTPNPVGFALAYNGGFTEYILVLWSNNTPQAYSGCASGKSLAQAETDCAGIMTKAQQSTATEEAPAQIVNPSISSFSVIGSTTANEMIAGVASGVRDSGLTIWEIVALAISVTLIFYVLYEVSELITANAKDVEAQRRRNS